MKRLKNVCLSALERCGGLLFFIAFILIVRGFVGLVEAIGTIMQVTPA